MSPCLQLLALKMKQEREDDTSIWLISIKPGLLKNPKHSNAGLYHFSTAMSLKTPDLRGSIRFDRLHGILGIMVI